VTCTATGAASCSDATHSVTFSATDKIDVLVVPSSTGGSGPSDSVMGWSAKLA
jgi:hypothetical protein